MAPHGLVGIPYSYPCRQGLTLALGVPGGGRRACAGDTAEYRAQHEPGAAGVVVIEDAAGDLPGRIQTGDGGAIAVQHLPRLADHDAAVGEGDATAHAVGDERWLVQAQGPVGLVGI